MTILWRNFVIIGTVVFEVLGAPIKKHFLFKKKDYIPFKYLSIENIYSFSHL